MHKLVLLRHGESIWNKENRFTGWTDVDLSEQGRLEAAEAGRLLKEGGFVFDVAYTSVLKRAVRTLWIVLDALDLMWIPVHNSWRLNERHYGALQGLNKAEMAAEIRRRADSGLAPQLRRAAAGAGAAGRALARARSALSRSGRRRAAGDRMPQRHGVALSAVLDRNDRACQFSVGERVIIAAHGNSLRALIKYLDDVSEQDIVGLNIPTGTPLVYELDTDLRPLRHYYLGDPQKVEAAMKAVAAQGKART